MRNCTLPTALSLIWLAALPAAAADWIAAPSTYTHDPTTGERVNQYTPIGPVYAFPRVGPSTYRQLRSSIQSGPLADHLHYVERSGAPVRPYGEWRFPFRPYSVPYPLWGPPYAGLGPSFGYGGFGYGRGHGYRGGRGYRDGDRPGHAVSVDPYGPGGPDFGDPRVRGPRPWHDGSYPEHSIRSRRFFDPRFHRRPFLHPDHDGVPHDHPAEP